MLFVADSIELTSVEIEKLEELLRRKTSVSQGVAERARIIILAGEGLTNEEIIKRTGLHRNSVSKWRNRYLQGGIFGDRLIIRNSHSEIFGDRLII